MHRINMLFTSNKSLKIIIIFVHSIMAHSFFYPHLNLKFFIVLIIIQTCILLTNSQNSYTTGCHYSCLYCFSPYYSQCVMCQPGFTQVILGNQSNQTNFNTLQDYPRGSCIGALNIYNVLGPIELGILIIALAVTKNHVFFYFISSIQTISLLSLLQIGYLNPLSYLMQSLEWFMLLTNIQKFFNNYDSSLYADERYRLSNFLYNVDLSTNMILVGSVGLISFLVVFGIPIIRYLINRLSKKAQSKQNQQKPSLLPHQQANQVEENQTQDNFTAERFFKSMEVIFAIVFFFTIQQTITIFAVGINYRGSNLVGGNIALIVGYALILVLMISNQCLKKLKVFPNKIIETTDTIKKLTFPLFLILPNDFGFFILIFLFLVNLIELFSLKRLNINIRKRVLISKDNLPIQVLNRQFNYRIIEEVAIILLSLFYVVDTIVNLYISSLICSIIAFIGLVIFLACFLFQIGLEIKRKFSYQLKVAPTQLTISNQTKLKPREVTQDNILTTSGGFVQTVIYSNFQEQIQEPKHQRKQRLDNILINNSSQLQITDEKQRKKVQVQNFEGAMTLRSEKTQSHTPKNSTTQLNSKKMFASTNNQLYSPLTPRSKVKRRDKNRITSVEWTQEKSIQPENLEQKQQQAQNQQKQAADEVTLKVVDIKPLKEQADKDLSIKLEPTLNIEELKDPKKRQLRQRYGTIKNPKRNKKQSDIMMNN